MLEKIARRVTRIERVYRNVKDDANYLQFAASSLGSSYAEGKL